MMQTTILDSFAINDNECIVNSKNKVMSLKVTNDSPSLKPRFCASDNHNWTQIVSNCGCPGHVLKNASFKGLEMDSEKSLASAPRCSMGQIQPPKAF